MIFVVLNQRDQFIHLYQGDLIMEKGRSEGTGRAILYGTTEFFLDRFGLESLEGLPPLTNRRRKN